jgi:transcription elongation factor Elf1
MPSSPEHHAKYMREVWYPKNRKKHCEMVGRSRKKRIKLRYDLVNGIKTSSKCLICNESDISCLDFHHLDPDKKEGTVAASIRWWSIERLMSEIKKCIILCSNCHRKLHAGTVSL